MSEQTSVSDGRLPSLDDEDDELGAPTAATRARSNVKLGVVVLLVVVVILLAVSVGIVAMKKRKAAQANAKPDVATQALKTDPTKVRNTAVEMPSIDAVKAQLKKDEAEAAAEAEESGKDGPADGYREKALKAAGQSGGPAGRPAGGSVPPAGQGQGQGVGAEAAVPVERAKTREERMLEDSMTAAAPRRQESPQSQQKGQQPNPAVAPQQPDAISALRTILAPQAAPAAGQGMSLAALNREATAGAATPEAGAKTGLESQLTPTSVDSRRAGRLGNLDFLLRKNTIIPCALVKGIDTTLPSFPDCKVINDVYSANGRTVLVERGAIINGEQRSRMENGQTRVFVLWTRIDNPSGTYAQLDSFGADQMGYGGLKAEVDTHFWARYSGAFLLSLIEDGLTAAVASAQKNGGGNTVQIGNTSSTAQGMANEALKNSINIPPTGRVKPATVISVVVARDIAFDSVYKVVQ